MCRGILLSLLLGFGLTIIRSETAESAPCSQGVPQPDTPKRLVELWLRFHLVDLCQTMDAVFIFNKNGMEIWSLVDDERSQQKLQEMVEPFREFYQIEVYATLPPSEKRSEDDKSPPPSLWENYELRANLGDAIARSIASSPFETRPFIDHPDGTLKQLLLMFAEQTLDRNRKLERYSADLPPLARVAFSPSVDSSISKLAKAVCLAHAQNLSKFASKLSANLKQALPRAGKGSYASARPRKSGMAPGDAVDTAMQISDDARKIAQRVHNFIHPEDYTIGLDELRNPSLLEALADLQKRIDDLQRVISMHESKQ